MSGALAQNIALGGFAGAPYAPALVSRFAATLPITVLVRPGLGDLLFPGFGPGEASIADPLTVPDDGGDFIEVGLSEPPADDTPITVTVGGVACFSGVGGQGGTCHPSRSAVPALQSTVTRVVRFVMPAGLATGLHDIVLTGVEEDPITLEDAILVVRRPRRGGDFAFRALFPAGSYSAMRGQADPAAGEVLDP